MKVSRSDVESNLPKKGFQKEKEKDHIYFHFCCDGKITHIHTKISHSKKAKDIDGGLLSVMCKQLKLEKNKDFVALVDCTMSFDQYKEFLQSRNLL